MLPSRAKPTLAQPPLCSRSTEGVNPLDAFAHGDLVNSRLLLRKVPVEKVDHACAAVPSIDDQRDVNRTVPKREAPSTTGFAAPAPVRSTIQATPGETIHRETAVIRAFGAL